MVPSKIKKGFTLVELLVVIAILAVLSSVAYVAVQRSKVRVMNDKVTADMLAIENALEQYRQDNDKKYPMPDPVMGLGKNKNVLCFYNDGAYAHDCANADILQTQVDNALLTKRYLQEVPTDPRTGNRYSYAVTLDGQNHQVAGITENEDGSYRAKVSGKLDFNYPARALIRSYNSQNFVKEAGRNLPYSPNHLDITATLTSVTGNVTIGNGQQAHDGDIVKPEDLVSTGLNSTVTLYLSDGSVTYLEEGSQLRLLPTSTIDQNDKDGIITKIRLKLLSGKIWNKVVRLSEKSEFNVETTSAIAGVRGTEFGIDGIAKNLTVFSGSVFARLKTPDETLASNLPGKSLDFDLSDKFFKAGSNLADSGNAVNPLDFTMAVANPIGNGSPVSAGDLGVIKGKYYSQPYSNLFQPRVSALDVTASVLTLTIPQKSAKNPDPLKPLKKVHAYDSATGLEVDAWVNDPGQPPQFTLNPGGKTLTVIPALAQAFFTIKGLNKSVLFALEDDHGNLTGLSEPPILLKATVKVDYDQLYGEDSELAQAAQPVVAQPTFTSAIPPSISLKGSLVLTSNIPCDWYIYGNGSGAFQDNAVPGVYATLIKNSAAVTYYAVQPDLTVSEKIDNVVSRFKNNAVWPVEVRCVSTSASSPFTSDDKLFSKANFDVNYEPWSHPVGPNLSNYEYSWTTKGSTFWSEAKIQCANLMEGGVNAGVWHLPNFATYEALAGGNNTTNLAEAANWCGQWKNNQCTDMRPGAGSIWLEETAPNAPANAYFITGFQAGIIKSTSKNDQMPARAFRCVK